MSELHTIPHYGRGKDLSGRQFGRLTVLGLSATHHLGKARRWVCLCKCGKQRLADRGSLTSGKTKSCGCLKHESRGRPMVDLVGKVFGRLTALRFLKRAGGACPTRWECRCACGKLHVVDGGNLQSGTTVSCGCYRRDYSSTHNRTHGMRKTPEYAAWASMRRRCGNPQDQGYADYGGRGITVCARWLESFENFFADLGKRPDKHSLERNDVNGNYEPSNCRWATRKEQQQNRRSAHLITLNGETHNLSVWAEKLGLSRHSLTMRARKTSDPAKLLRPSRQRPCPHCGCLISF